MKRQLEAQFTCFTSMTAPFVEIMFHGAVNGDCRVVNTMVYQSLPCFNKIFEIC